MIDRHWRSPVLVAAVLSAGSLLAPGQAPAAAGSDGACPGTTGVTVVVDYQALGGGVVVRCAPGSPATGFKALTAAGFRLEEVRNVPGFLCRIDSRPGPEREACINTPPAAAYWSYWHAARGGTWATSGEGARTRTPPPGSVEGWSFSDDGSPGGPAPAPGIDPPAKPAKPKPATPKPATPKPATPKPTVTPRPATPKPAIPKPATPKPEVTAEPIDTPAPLDSPTLIPSTATAEETPMTAVGPADASPTPTLDTAAIAVVGAVSGGSPPHGTLLGIGLVVLIVAGALVTRSRRSRSEDGDA